jgi:glutathione peroxidase
MFAKIRVAGPDAHPLYAELTRSTGEPPRWNFHKYLIDRSGRPVASYPSRVAPDAAPLVRAIEKALAERV